MLIKPLMQMPLGFGNVVVLQTMFSKLMMHRISGVVIVALVSHLPELEMAVGTGFANC